MLCSNSGTGLFGAPTSSSSSGFGFQSQTPALSGPNNSSLLGTTANVGNFGTSFSNSGVFSSMASQNASTSTPSIFNTTNQSKLSNPFGTPSMSPGNANPLFGGSSVSGSGLSAQGTFSGLFGQPSVNQSTNLFGSVKPQTSANLFGASSSGTSLFGPTGATTSNQKMGTKHLYTYEASGDLLGDRQSRIQCITAVPDINQAKNLDELRWEDYQLTQKINSGSSGFGGGTSLFSSTSQHGSLLFSGPKMDSNTGVQGVSPGSSLFGSGGSTSTNFSGQQAVPQQATQNPSPFGSSLMPSASLFGSGGTGAGAITNASLFNTNTGGSFGISAPKPFENTLGTTSGVAGSQGLNTGGNLFGLAPQQSTGGLFGNTSVASTPNSSLCNPLGTSSMGQQNGATGLFGNTNSFFGQPLNNAAVSSSASKSGIFGQSNQFPNLFSNSTTGTSLFNKPGESVFGSSLGNKEGGSSSLFGSTSGNSLLSQPSTSLFGKTGTSLFDKPSFANQNIGTGLNLGTNQMLCPSFGNNLGGIKDISKNATVSLSGTKNSNLFESSHEAVLGSSLFGGNASLAPNTAHSGSPFGAPSPNGFFAQGHAAQESSVGQNSLSAFLFLGSEKAFPSVLTRYKTVALAQVWRPLPEHTISSRSKILPVLTPKRFCRPRYCLSHIKAGQYQNYENLNLDAGVRSAALRTAFNVGLSPLSCHSGRDSGSDVSRFSSVFRQVSYSDKGQHNSCDKWNSEVKHSKYVKHILQTCEPLTGRTVANQENGLKGSWYGLDSSRRLDTVFEFKTLENKEHLWEAPLSQETPYYADSFLCGKQSYKPLRVPLKTVMHCCPSNHLDHEWSSPYGVEDSENPHTVNLSGYGRLEQDTGYLTRRMGRLGLDLVSASRNNSSLTERRWKTAAPLCTREDYCTRPTLETLRSYSESRLAAVEDFTVIREGYGEITWPGLTDVRGLNIDQVIIIEDKAVEVYPESSLDSGVQSYPPVGVGLNKPALITLYDCGPQDADSLNAPYGSKKKIYETHVEKMRLFTKKMGGTFVSLSPQWTWKFRVEHFTRYGLNKDV